MKTFIAATLIALTLGAFTLHNYYSTSSASLQYSDRLNTIASQVNSMNSTWKAGSNIKWSGQTEESIKGLMISSELFRTRVTPSHKQFFHNFSAVQSAPASFDSRDAWPGCSSLREVRDQSSCGSCWAFGAAEVMSDRICIASGQKDQTRVSAEDLVECCTDCGYGCEGGFPSAAFDFWESQGIVTGGLYGDQQYCKNYPFAPCAHHTTSDKYPACPGNYDTPSCKRECTNGSDYRTSKTYGSSYTVSGERQMMAEISTNGPVEVSFSVYEDFLTYKTGVYQHLTGSSLGGHAVKAVGYGEENGTKYWLIANSWNETWGLNGFFKIIRGEDACGIEGEAATGMPRAN